MKSDDLKMLLLIDDEEDLCSILKISIELGGRYRVMTALNGKDGLQIAREHKPALIILDVMMPGIDGIEVLKILKEDQDTIGIPVIMYTAKDDDNTKMRSVTGFCDEFLIKPVDSKPLLEKIDNVLKRKKKAQ